MSKKVVVFGGYAGVLTAKKLAKKLKKQTQRLLLLMKIHFMPCCQSTLSTYCTLYRFLNEIK